MISNNIALINILLSNSMDRQQIIYKMYNMMLHMGNTFIPKDIVFIIIQYTVPNKEHFIKKFNKTEIIQSVHMTVVENELYVVDDDGIKIFDPNGNFCREWKIRSARCILSYRNEFYITNWHDNNVQIFDQNGKLLRKWGSYGSAIGQFNTPSGIIEHNDQIYVVDSYNQRIKVYDPTGKIIKILSNNIKNPYGITTTKSHIYITNHTESEVLIFDNMGNYLKKFGTVGKEDGQFNHPANIMAHNDELYISDFDNDRIQVFDLEGHYQRQCAGTDVERMNGPTGIVVWNDLLYIANYRDKIIQVFNNQTNIRKLIQNNIK